MPEPSPPTDVFEMARPRLLGIAYRMLGTLADAEDVVQDAWLRWHRAAHETVQRPEAWLTTVTTRLALDRARALRRSREEYVGPWLPEPIVSDPGPEEASELSETLALRFLQILDLLSPVERAVFLLVDVFGVPYREVAATLDKSDVACRQIASRARRNVRRTRHEHVDPAQRRVVDELMTAVLHGDIGAALARMAPDVVFVSDGGPRRAARRRIVGASKVARLLANLARRDYRSAHSTRVTVNGDPGLIVRLAGRVDFVAAFEVCDGQVAAIWIMRNPDKLSHLDRPPALQ